MFFVYVDESHDNVKFWLSAIIIRHRKWNEFLAECQSLRARLRADFDIKLHAEIDACELVRGKGRCFCSELCTWQSGRWQSFDRVNGKGYPGLCFAQHWVNISDCGTRIVE